MRLAEYRSKSALLADFLPWAALIAPGVILNKDGSLQRTARFRGPDLDSATPAELVATSARLNSALRRLGSGWTVFVEAQRIPAQDYPASEFPDPVSALVDAERRAQFEEAGAHFESAYFLTLVWMPPADDASRAEGWLLENAPDRSTKPQDLVSSFVGRADRLTDLLDGFMPEIAWLSDAETLTYLHSTVSTRRQRVRVPEVPMHLDAVLADDPLVGGLTPRLGAAHLKTLTIIGLPSATWPGLLDELNAQGFEYRWCTRAICLDKTDAARVFTRIRRQWFAKRKSVAAILKEVMTNEASTLLDSDAANKAADADEALQELGADVAGAAYVTATITVWDEDAAAAEAKLKATEKIVQGRDFTCIPETLNALEAWLGSLPGHLYRQCPSATHLDVEPRPYDPDLGGLGGAGPERPSGRPATVPRRNRRHDAVSLLHPCGRCRPYLDRRPDRGGQIGPASVDGAAVPALCRCTGLRLRLRRLDPLRHARHGRRLGKPRRCTGRRGTSGAAAAARRDR